MKTAFFLMSIVALSVTTLAQRKNETKDPFIGSWKFSNQSKLNDFQKVFESQQQREYQTEYFTFESDHRFKHEFINKDGNSVRILKGKWKSVGDKIKIDYTDVDFSFTVDYFFIDKDLVLGKNFNHVIFIKENTDYNFTMK